MPGVFFCNRAITLERPHIADISASVLRLFGQTVPRLMQGRMIFAEAGGKATVKGPIDPTTLSQSGSAPGALIHRFTREAASA